VANEMDRLNMIRIIPSIHNENTNIKKEIKCDKMFILYFTNVKKVRDLTACLAIIKKSQDRR
jgi:hypothetical protein